MSSSKRLRLGIFLMGVIISGIVFEEIADDVFSDPVEGDFEARDFDDAIRAFFKSFKTPALTQIMIDLTALGSISVIGVLLGVFLTILGTYRDYRGIAYLLTVSLGAGVWPMLLKLYFQRPRPALELHLVPVSDLSFPSGHAFGSTAIYIALAFYAGKYALSWRQEIFFYCLGVVLFLLVGLSRIYLGVHYPTDVLAGIAGGAFWALLVSMIVILLRDRWV